jgi:hypothetical protein
MPLTLESLSRRLRHVQAYCAILTFSVIGGILTAFRSHSTQRARFVEIDVERVNIVERDGKLRMIIANKERLPGPVERGVSFGYGSGRRMGLVFYNDEGTEMGGLAFGSARSGEQFESGVTLAFDQYDQDQAVVLQQYENNDRRRSGLAIAEYPTSLTNRQRTEQWEQLRSMPPGRAREQAMDSLAAFDGRTRAYFGRAFDGTALVTLADAAGRTRLRLQVDTAGVARIEFLNDSGRVVRAIPE